MFKAIQTNYFKNIFMKITNLERAGADVPIYRVQRIVLSSISFKDDK